MQKDTENWAFLFQCASPNEILLPESTNTAIIRPANRGVAQPG